MNIKPLFDKVIVKAIEEVTTGLTIPGDSRDTPKNGIVVACADGLAIKENDKVMFGEYSGAKFKHDGEEFIMMREKEIFAIFK